MIVISQSGEWRRSYNNNEIALDGTSSPITLNINLEKYIWEKEDNSLHTSFDSTNMTVDGSVTLRGNGYLKVNNTVVNNGSLIIETKNFVIDGTLTGKNVILAKGSTLTVGMLKASITFAASDKNTFNTLIITNYAESGSLTLNNFSPYDKIIFNKHNNIHLQWGNDGKTIVDQSGAVLANVNFARGYNRNNYMFRGSVVEVNSFLAGSMICTSQGDVAVEDIQINDTVVAFDWKNNKDISRSVVWVGKSRTMVQAELSDDEAGWPVRIVKDAIGDNVFLTRTCSLRLDTVYFLRTDLFRCIC
ncbi:hypothetical protein ACI01nite_23150 [Acetobacter cibinongensis]|uniref:Hedgehog/Intein (Hint) domain-containing protein n=1 Tax=Acetobacter cibinongensis TaxID=146475 RepID=A0A0D6N7J0_9PROT|nr:hypothetical protein Abci_035_004 [Acetobacter cibinongensis]GBQ15650.1 hypothetical protein AA0482_1309 [Acetobacter cibinongensis NRIC 0482]GEL59713.1 hypothetical protein ACI01nite_23150 [Acetobacter cibinongensis]